MRTPLSVYTFVIIVACLVFISTLLSCKKDGGNGSDSLRSLLAGTPDKVWQLQRGQDSDYWQHDNKWHHYTFNEGVAYVFSPCVLSSNYFALQSDGIFIESVYTCDPYAPTGDYFISQNGNTGRWKLADDNETLMLLDQEYRLVSVTANELVISNVTYGTLYFSRVNSLPFSTRNEQLAGTVSKTWKYTKLEYNYNYSGDSLTPKQKATRLTYMANGTLAISYTDAAFGQPVTGAWSLFPTTSYPSNEVNDYALRNTLPDSAGVLLQNLDQTVTELSNNSMIVSYRDSSLNNTKLYLKPE